MALSFVECSEENKDCTSFLFEAVKVDWIPNKFRLALDTYSEFEIVTSLTEFNEEGETPLVVAINGENAPVIEELMNVLRNCDLEFELEKRQLMSVINQLVNQIPIMKWIEYLIVNADSDWLKFIGQVIKSTPLNHVNRQEKIVALELIGASLIIHSISITSADLQVDGLIFWNIAMALRYSPANGGPLLPKLPDMCVPSEASSVVFGSAVEVMTKEELILLREDFGSNCLSGNLVMRLPSLRRIQIQALLVIKRISTQANLGHPQRLYLSTLLKFCKNWMYEIKKSPGYSVDSKIVINASLLILEQMNGFDPQLILPDLNTILKETFNFMTDFFITMLWAPLDSPGRRELTYVNFLAPSKFLSIIVKNMSNNEAFNHFAGIVYEYLYILKSISPQLTNQEQQNLEKLYFDCLRDFPERMTTVLHVAVKEFTGYEYDLETTKLILKLGADPNAMDEHGQTPLHILAKEIMPDDDYLLDWDDYLLVFQILVDAGGHLDMADEDGHTVLCFLGRDENDVIMHPYFESLLKTVFPLSCYAARVIRRNGIRFDEDRLPRHLQTFVASHSAKDYSTRLSTVKRSDF